MSGVDTAYAAAVVVSGMRRVNSPPFSPGFRTACRWAEAPRASGAGTVSSEGQPDEPVWNSQWRCSQWWCGERMPRLSARSALSYSHCRHCAPLCQAPPPLGVRADTLVFLWTKIAAVIAIALFVSTWAHYGPRP